MIRKLISAAVAASALMIGASQAKETIVWWDFLSGGDGVRMKALISEFNKEHANAVEIQATTLEWGVPFYTKVQTSTAVGDGPDIMTYHELRMPLGISTNVAEPDFCRTNSPPPVSRPATSDPRTGRRRKARTASNMPCRSISTPSSSTTTRTSSRKPACSATTASPRGSTASPTGTLRSPS